MVVYLLIFRWVVFVGRRGSTAEPEAAVGQWQRQRRKDPGQAIRAEEAAASIDESTMLPSARQRAKAPFFPDCFKTIKQRAHPH